MLECAKIVNLYKGPRDSNMVHSLFHLVFNYIPWSTWKRKLCNNIHLTTQKSLTWGYWVIPAYKEKIRLLSTVYLIDCRAYNYETNITCACSCSIKWLPVGIKYSCDCNIMYNIALDNPLFSCKFRVFVSSPLINVQQSHFSCLYLHSPLQWVLLDTLIHFL
jgi:hypothetical protein